MTSSQIDYLFIIPSVLLIIVPLWDLITNTSQRGLKRITKIGWLLFFLAIIFAGLSAYKISTQSIEKDKDKKLSDSTRSADKEDLRKSVDAALKKYGLQLGNNTKTVTIVDTTKKISPVMDLIRDSCGYFGRYPDSVMLIFNYHCINNGIAFIRSNSITSFIIFKNKFYKLSTTNKMANLGIKSYIGYHVYLGTPILKFADFNRPVDTSFYFFRATYADKETGGHIQPVLRGIFYMHSSNPKSIKDFKLKEVDNISLYRRLRDTLIKAKLW